MVVCEKKEGCHPQTPARGISVHSSGPSRQVCLVSLVSRVTSRLDARIKLSTVEVCCTVCMLYVVSTE